jgi:hypothetical protein
MTAEIIVKHTNKLLTRKFRGKENFCPLMPYSLITNLQCMHIFPISGKTETEIEIRLPAHSAKKFGVCIDSPLFGNLKTKAIIENIEINKVLGAEWFTFYIYKADQTVIEVV